MTAAEIRAAADALLIEEAELKAASPDRKLSRADYIAKVHAWAALHRETMKLQRTLKRSA